jgi:hypothetical protein
MTTTRSFSVTLITKGFFTGTVEAATAEDAVEETFRIWRTECPHPFEKADDDELVDVTVDEAVTFNPPTNKESS